MTVDAILNTANSSLLVSDIVNSCIHCAVSKGLLEECKTFGGCETGKAKITSAYNLPCKHVTHAVGSIASEMKKNC